MNTKQASGIVRSLASDTAKLDRQAQAAAILRPTAGSNLARAWS